MAQYEATTLLMRKGRVLGLSKNNRLLQRGQHHLGCVTHSAGVTQMGVAFSLFKRSIVHELTPGDASQHHDYQMPDSKGLRGAYAYSNR